MSQSKTTATATQYEHLEPRPAQTIGRCFSKAGASAPPWSTKPSMVLIRIHPKSSPATFTSPWRPFTKLSNTLLETEHSLSKSESARLPTSGPAALIGTSGHEDADQREPE